MTNRQIARQMVIESFLAEFSKGTRTLKDLTVCQNFPANTINELVKQGYVIKISRGVYKWRYTINSDQIEKLAKVISNNWNTKNVYERSQAKLIGDFSSNELIDEINRRKLALYWDIQNTKFVLK